MLEQTYFRKGLGLKAQVKPIINAEYHSRLVDRIRARGYTDVFGDVTIRLAQEFGFCYGVDRAIDYAYQTVRRYPDRRTHLVGEIIHNPHVNQRLREMGIRFISASDDGSFDFSHLTHDDVVLIPAFGVTQRDFQALRGVGCILVDTTCGSVLNVWKRVERYARDGFTAVIHGKYTHEESRATASQVTRYDGGKYLIVRDMAEAGIVCDFIARRSGHLSGDEFQDHFRDKATPGFDPGTDLGKIGVANQTTMLASESLAIAARIRAAMVAGHGEEHARECFRSFDTICSATQERQDALEAMMARPPDIMIVVGGYNSSNTNHLASICRDHTVTYHVADAVCIDTGTGAVRHKPGLDPDAPEVVARDWLPEGPFELGITAGASTPNNKIGEALTRLLAIRGVLSGAEVAQPAGIGGDGGARSRQLPLRAKRAVGP